MILDGKLVAENLDKYTMEKINNRERLWDY